MNRKLICILCPRGCPLTAEIAGENVTVTGNGCPRGETYAVSELLHPMRTVTATIRVANRKNTMVPVKTEKPVPKEAMMDVMAALRAITATAPIATGQILIPDLLGTKILATREIP